MYIFTNLFFTSFMQVLYVGTAIFARFEVDYWKRISHHFTDSFLNWGLTQKFVTTKTVTNLDKLLIVKL